MTTLSPDPTDVAVGARLRQFRREKGYTQHSLGDGLNLSFQQVQKYETGANRISASKLWDAARFLGVKVSDFFVDVDETAPPPPPSPLADKDTRALLKAWDMIERADQRTAIIKLVETMSDEYPG